MTTAHAPPTACRLLRHHPRHRYGSTTRARRPQYSRSDSGHLIRLLESRLDRRLAGFKQQRTGNVPYLTGLSGISVRLDGGSVRRPDQSPSMRPARAIARAHTTVVGHAVANDTTQYRPPPQRQWPRSFASWASLQPNMPPSDVGCLHHQWCHKQPVQTDKNVVPSHHSATAHPHAVNS